MIWFRELRKPAVAHLEPEVSRLICAHCDDQSVDGRRMAIRSLTETPLTQSELLVTF